MSKYICLDDIDVWDVCGHIQGCLRCDFDDGKRCMIHEWINKLPTIDVVYCVECRYKDSELCPMYKLKKAGVLKPYDFCSYGDRREE